jgi:hypothetical protein
VFDFFLPGGAQVNLNVGANIPAPAMINVAQKIG